MSRSTQHNHRTGGSAARWGGQATTWTGAQWARLHCTVGLMTLVTLLVPREAGAQSPTEVVDAVTETADQEAHAISTAGPEGTGQASSIGGREGTGTRAAVGGRPVRGEGARSTSTTALQWTPSDELVERAGAEVGVFFERKPLGFSIQTVRQIGASLIDSLGLVPALAAGWWRELLEHKLLSLGVLLGLALLAFLALWGDRRLRSVITGQAERVDLPGPAVLTTGLGIVIRVAGRLIVPAALLLVSILVVRAIAGEAGWALLLTDALVLWVVYRALTGLLVELVRAERIGVEEETARRNRELLIGGVWLVVMFQLVRSILEDLDYGRDAAALVDFLMWLSLTLMAFRLVAMRDTVLGLLPESGPKLYERLRSGLYRFYRHILIVTGLLGLMWTFGYHHAAAELFWRLYLGIGLLVLGSLGWRLLERRLDFEDDAEAAGLVKRLLEAAGGYLRFFVWLVAAAVGLSLVGLYGPFVSVLRLPLFRLGSVNFSVYVVFRAVVFFVGFLLVSRMVRRLLEIRVYQRRDVDEGLGYAINTMAHYVLLVMGSAMALVSTGLDLSILGFAAGALGVGAGFGLQEIVRDVVSGFVLLFGRAVKKGDFVTVGNEFGEVSSVGARSVRLRTRDNVELLVPTSQIVNNTIINWTHTNAQARLHVAVGTSYRAEPSAVREALLKAASQYEPVAKHPPPAVWLVNFGDSAVEYALIIWVNVKRHAINRIKGELYFLIWDKLREANIEIPFPQRDLHIKSIAADARLDLSTERPQQEPDGQDSAKKGGKRSKAKGAKKSKSDVAKKSDVAEKSDDKGASE